MNPQVFNCLVTIAVLLLLWSIPYLLHKIWKKAFGPKPLPPEPAWRGKCDCCGNELTANTAPSGKVECIACVLEWSEASKQRAADRKQIELYKIAIREVEAEKNQEKQ